MFGTSKDLFSKKLSFDVDGRVNAFASFFFAVPYYVILLGILWALGYESFILGKTFLLFVCARATCDVFAEWLKMESLSRGDISLVVSFLSLSPLFLLFLSPLLTKDPLQQKEVIALIGIVIGTLIIAPKRHKESAVPYKAIFIALGSSFFMALNVCFDRLAVQESSAALAGFSMTLLAALILAPFSLFRSAQRESLYTYKQIFSIRGFLEVAFMTTKLAALQFLSAPMVSGISKISLLLSIIGGKVIFKEEDSLKRLIGGACIASSIFVLLW